MSDSARALRSELRRDLAEGGTATRAIVYLFAGAYAAICLATLPDGPFSAPDSVAYLEMQPIVPLGYPAFLRIFGASTAVVLQPLIFAFALIWLGLATLRVSKHVIVAVAVMAGIAATPDLRDYHHSILSESLFASGLVAFLGAITAFAEEPSLKRAFGASIIAGVTVTIRRAAYAFLPVLIVMVLMHRRRATHRASVTLLFAVLPTLAVPGVEAIAARAVHGDDATSLTGRHLFAKAALIDVGEEASARRAAPTLSVIDQALDVQFAPIRALIARAPRDIRASLIVFYETCLQGPCVESLRASLARMSEAQKNAALADAAIARIVVSPIAFLGLTGVHYRSLWTAYKLRHPHTATTMNAFLAANRPLPFEREAFKVTPQQAIAFEGSTMVRIVQPLVIVAGIVTGGLTLCALAGAFHTRLSPLGSVATLAALTAHGCLLFSAVAAAGISRFMVSAFPAVVSALVLGLWWTGQAVRTRVTRGSRYH